MTAEGNRIGQEIADLEIALQECAAVIGSTMTLRTRLLARLAAAKARDKATASAD